VKEYFDNLKQTIENDGAEIPPQQIYNYDETCLTDDPGTKKCIFKRGVKYPERVKDSSKTAISVMFCGNSVGNLVTFATKRKIYGQLGRKVDLKARATTEAAADGSMPVVLPTGLKLSSYRTLQNRTVERSLSETTSAVILQIQYCRKPENIIYHLFVCLLIRHIFCSQLTLLSMDH